MKKLFLLPLLLIFAACGNSLKDTSLFWGSTNESYNQNEKPETTGSGAFLHPAWKGEKIAAEAVVWTEMNITDAEVSVSCVRNGLKCIPAENIEVSFAKYVMSDGFQDGYVQCGFRNKEDFDSLLVADMLGDSYMTDIDKNTCQPVWLSIKVPHNAVPGTYKGKVKLKSAEGTLKLPFSFEVVDMTLPEPSEWEYHLDLWQNPYSVARYHGVKPWSEEHFRYMEPVMKILAEAGQKVITTTILDKPWNGQTEDAFGSMVTKTLKSDGTWEYGYEAFDRWVQFMMDLGIDRQISCYSMIPWHLEFDYYDETLGQMCTMKAAPSSKEYKTYWGHFISDFADHLREKGWYEKTVIAMDERPEDQMKAALEVIHSVQPDLKVSLAGNWHESLESHLYDYCIAFRQDYPEGILEKRKEEGKISTVYTCCAERYPNTFMASPHAEAVWIPWYVLAKGYDGYLRWSYNSWTADPVADARFRAWPAGDCYIVYPEGRSSIRMEKVIEGIQDYEKARILIEKWKNEGNQARLSALEESLKAFTYENLSENGAEEAVLKAKTEVLHAY